MRYKIIFMVERSKKIAGHLELDEIKTVMKKYKDSRGLNFFSSQIVVVWPFLSKILGI